MTNTVSLIGGHFTRNGVEQNWPARVIISVNGNGLGEQHEDTIAIFRDTTIYGGERPSDLYTNPLGTTMEFARYWYDQLAPIWRSNPADYYTITNEQSGKDNEDEISILLAYERNITELASLDGMKTVVAKIANNSPDMDVWIDWYLPFIVDMFNQYGSIYGRHVYGNGDLVNEDGTINSDAPMNPSRILDEIQELRRYGYQGGIAFSETGIDGGYNLASWERFAQNATGLEQILRDHSDIVIGFCWWECGQTEWSANYTQHLKDITPYMREHLLPRWQPGATPPPLPEDECPGFIDVRREFNLLPQDLTRDELARVTQDLYELRNSFGQSHDDGILVVSHGNEERSLLRVYNPERRNPGDLAAIEESGVRWEIAYLPGTTPPADAFRFTHWPCESPVVTQRFRARPDYYSRFGLPGHDGTDLRATLGSPIYAVASGEIVDINENPNIHNYGIFVRVRHTDDFETTYAHLERTAVSLGQSINGGERVGFAGSTGNSSGIHLHLTLKKIGSVFVDECNSQWPYNIHDSDPYLEALGGQWPATIDCPEPDGETIDVASFQQADPLAWRVIRHPDGRQEDIRDMALGDGLFVRAKNSLGEWWQIANGFAYLIHDTSPDVGAEGVARVYTIYKNGLPGAPKNPERMEIGKEWRESSSHHVQFRARTDCRELDENSGSATNTAVLTRYEAPYTFNAYGQNLTLDEVIWIQTGVESQIYAKHDGKIVGWCGWVAPWGQSEIVELHWNRGALQDEPPRYCNF